MTEFANRHGTGAFRRRQLLVAVDDTTVAAAIEDEMHHFEIRLHHDGERVTAVDGAPVRWPWAPCLDSTQALAALVGLAITASPTDIAHWADARQQCTHQFDLAALAVAHAARQVGGGAARRDYLTEVPDWHEPPFIARLWVDGELTLDWVCSADAVLAPEQYRGAPMRSGFFDWCAEHLDADLTEAAQVLRRAAWISPARKIDLEAADQATDSGIKHDVCYTSQPERLPLAIRSRGSLRDFSHSSAPLLASFRP